MTPGLDPARADALTQLIAQIAGRLLAASADERRGPSDIRAEDIDDTVDTAGEIVRMAHRWVWQRAMEEWEKGGEPLWPWDWSLAEKEASLGATADVPASDWQRLVHRPRISGDLPNTSAEP